MNKWSNAAKVRLVEIQSAKEAAEDIRTIAEAFSKLPFGQLKKILSDDVAAVLKKYGMSLE